MRQLLIESLLLAIAGGAAGMIVAILGVRALVVLSPAGLPRAGALGVDAGVFVFGLIVTTAVGVAFGLIPALQAAGIDPQLDLREAARQTTGGFRGVRRALVVAEIAIALVLLVTSGLLLRSLDRLFAVPVVIRPLLYVLYNSLDVASSMGIIGNYEPRYTAAIYHRGGGRCPQPARQNGPPLRP